MKTTPHAPAQKAPEVLPDPIGGGSWRREPDGSLAVLQQTAPATGRRSAASKNPAATVTASINESPKE